MEIPEHYFHLANLTLPLSLRLELEDRIWVLAFLSKLPENEEKRLRNAFLAFSDLVIEGLLPQKLKDYEAQNIIDLALKEPNKLSQSWSFLSSFLIWLVEKQPMHPSLRVLWLPPYLWRKTPKEKAQQQVETFLRFLLFQIEVSSGLHSLRSIIFMLAKTVSCRSSQELYQWPLEKLPHHPSPAYPLEKPIEKLFKAWQKLVLSLQDIFENKGYFFPRLRKTTSPNPRIDWLMPFEQIYKDTSIEIEHYPQLIGSLVLTWSYNQKLFIPLIKKLYHVIKQLEKEPPF